MIIFARCFLSFGFVKTDFHTEQFENSRSFRGGGDANFKMEYEIAIKCVPT